MAADLVAARVAEPSPGGGCRCSGSGAGLLGHLRMRPARTAWSPRRFRTTRSWPAPRPAPSGVWDWPRSSRRGGGQRRPIPPRSAGSGPVRTGRRPPHASATSAGRTTTCVMPRGRAGRWEHHAAVVAVTPHPAAQADRPGRCRPRAAAWPQWCTSASRSRVLQILHDRPVPKRSECESVPRPSHLTTPIAANERARTCLPAGRFGAFARQNSSPRRANPQ
jgi:hypothetical protein